jgi:hypothetical protein
MAPAASATESKADGEGLKCGLRACADAWRWFSRLVHV